MAEALADAMAAAVSGRSDTWRFVSYRQFMRKYNELAELASSIEPIDAPLDLWDLTRVPDIGDTLAMQQGAYFENVRANLAILIAYLTNRVRPKQRQVSEITDFLQANLRRATLRQPERERDVQDTVEQLLIGRGLEKGLDYDREVGRVKVSSKEVIPDFILPLLKTAIEVKLVKEPSATGRVVDEINADIRAYGLQYDSVVFVVYDSAGVIRDEAEFRRDLEDADGVRVLVVKH